jgi:hypothetical protein
MPRDAYISIYGLGGLAGFCRGVNIASQIGLGRPTDGQFVFYSSLFQAGLDRIVTTNVTPLNLQQQIPAYRLHILESSNYELVYFSVRAFFDHYMGSDWQQKKDIEAVQSLHYFITDLLVSFHLGRPLLTTLPCPDIDAFELSLPVEILALAKTLFKSIEEHHTSVALPTLKVAKAQIGVFDEIIASQAYKDVENTHQQMLLKPSVTESCLAQLEKANYALYWKWKDFLRIKSSAVQVARNIPDVVDAMFGKAPSNVVKPVIELLAAQLQKDTPILIYDTSPILNQTMRSVIQQAEKSPRA